MRFEILDRRVRVDPKVAHGDGRDEVEEHVPRVVCEEVEPYGDECGVVAYDLQLEVVVVVVVDDDGDDDDATKPVVDRNDDALVWVDEASMIVTKTTSFVASVPSMTMMTSVVDARRHSRQGSARRRPTKRRILRH